MLMHSPEYTNLYKEKAFFAKIQRGCMAKKCIYCKNEIPDESVIDFCKRCGIGVWGEKMFNAIVESMEKSRAAGDLFQGSVSNPVVAKRI